MSVLLIPNPTKDTGLAVTRQAAAVLAGRGIPVLMPQPLRRPMGWMVCVSCRRSRPTAPPSRS